MHSGAIVTPWEFLPDAATGIVQLLFGASVFAGKEGFAPALWKMVSLHGV